MLCLLFVQESIDSVSGRSIKILLIAGLKILWKLPGAAEFTIHSLSKPPTLSVTSKAGGSGSYVTSATTAHCGPPRGSVHHSHHPCLSSVSFVRCGPLSCSHSYPQCLCCPTSQQQPLWVDNGGIRHSFHMCDVCKGSGHVCPRRPTACEARRGKRIEESSDGETCVKAEQLLNAFMTRMIPRRPNIFLEEG